VEESIIVENVGYDPDFLDALKAESQAELRAKGSVKELPEGFFSQLQQSWDLQLMSSKINSRMNSTLTPLLLISRRSLSPRYG